MSGFDCKSAKVKGAQDHARARVIWIDGRISGYNQDGKLFDLNSEKPKRRSGYIRSWDAQTESGTIHIDESCWTCGGWLTVAMKSIDKLINEAQL